MVDEHSGALHPDLLDKAAGYGPWDGTGWHGGLCDFGGARILVECGDFKDSVLGISGRYQTSTDVDICRLYYLCLWDDAPQFRVSFRGLESTNQLRFVGALDGTMRFSLVFIQRMDEWSFGIPASSSNLGWSHMARWWSDRPHELAVQRTDSRCEARFGRSLPMGLTASGAGTTVAVPS